MSIIAGLRDYTIGTDISTYGHWLFLNAKEKLGVINFVKSHQEIDVLYSCFVYIIAQIFTYEHWLYFFTGLWIYGFTLAGIKKYEKYASVSWIWVCYLFLLYGDTLNAMRQCMAMALCIWAFQYVLERKYVKYVFCILIACLFHITAIVYMGIFVVYELIKRKNSLVIKGSLLLGLSIVLFSYNKVLLLLIKLGFFNEKFERYLTVNVKWTSVNPILIRIPFLFLILLFYHIFLEKINIQKEKEKNNIIKSQEVFGSFLLIMAIIEIMTAEMRSVNVTLYRISLYFCMFRCIAIGRVVNVVNRNNKKIIKIVIIALLIVIWIYQNVVQRNNEIYPYKSIILNIR